MDGVILKPEDGETLDTPTDYNGSSFHKFLDAVCSFLSRQKVSKYKSIISTILFLRTKFSIDNISHTSPKFISKRQKLGWLTDSYLPDKQFFSHVGTELPGYY